LLRVALFRGGPQHHFSRLFSRGSLLLNLLLLVITCVVYIHVFCKLLFTYRNLYRERRLGLFPLFSDFWRLLGICLGWFLRGQIKNRSDHLFFSYNLDHKFMVL
jgi:hypothetical protein